MILRVGGWAGAHINGFGAKHAECKAADTTRSMKLEGLTVGKVVYDSQ